MAVLVVGLTGQTGAGKSAVSDILRRHDLMVINCDLTARKAVAPGSACLEEIADFFGPDVLLPGGELNRKKVAGIVFADPAARERYNKIIHKAIIDLLQIEIKTAENAGVPVVVLDAPTLFESGADRLCQVVVSVTAPREKRLARILARDSLSEEEALLRMGAQHEDAFYTGRSDFVIENDRDFSDLEKQAEDLAKALKEKAGGR